MPVMSIAERWFCQSPPWRWVAGRLVLGWALQGVPLRGAVLELGGGGGAMAEETIRRHPDCQLTVTDLDPVMVASAQRRFANEPRVTARHADAGRGVDSLETLGQGCWSWTNSRAGSASGPTLRSSSGPPV